MQKITHLGVFAHADDTEDAAYHGILECFNSDEKNFMAVIVTDGGGCPRENEYKTTTREEMIEIRKLEQEGAAKIGRYAGLVQLGLTSDSVKDKNNTDVVKRLTKILAETKPETVYTHNLADKHPTHVAVALRLITAIRNLQQKDRPKRLLGCEGWRGLGWLDEGDKVILDVGGNDALAEQLLGAFPSQQAFFNLAGGTIARRIANASSLTTHSAQTTYQCTFAMDLTPLILDDTLDIKKFVKAHLDKFSDSVSSLLD